MADEEAEGQEALRAVDPLFDLIRSRIEAEAARYADPIEREYRSGLLAAGYLVGRIQNEWAKEARRITDAIDADPAEVERLRASRESARAGRRHPLQDEKIGGNPHGITGITAGWIGE